MQTQRIICQWCGSQNLMGATTCQSCGAPLDVRDMVVERSEIAMPAQPSAALPVLNYQSARIEGDVRWVTVATFEYCGQLHAARAVLTKLNIVSRIGPAFDDSPQFDLQTDSSEAELARVVLARTMPKEIVAPSRRSGSPAIPACAVLNFSGEADADYSRNMTMLWIVAILIVLSVYWICR